MEVIVVVGVAGVILAVAIVGLGSVLGRSGGKDELEAERGASGHTEEEGMGAQPVRDRPAGPGAESQQPDMAGGDFHPREQQPETDEVATPSEAAGKRQPDRPDEERS